jgi:hypothetical protein
LKVCLLATVLRHIFRGHAILFWDDLADRHLKILEVTSADDFPP